MERIKKQDYAKTIIEELEKMRSTSILQFYKNDMYEGEKIEGILEWYDEIEKCIRTHPHEKPVKTVIVYESADSINRVEYEYGEPKEKPDFRFVTEMPLESSEKTVKQ